MAVVKGTNAGFVTSSPSADPEGVSTTITGSIFAQKHTTPAGTNIITEMGWYHGATLTNDVDYQLGWYSHDATGDGGNGSPNVLLDGSGDLEKGTTEGWKKTGSLDWDIENAETTHWLALQIDADGGGCDYSATTDEHWVYVGARTYLESSWPGTSGRGYTRMYSVYALYDEAGSSSSSSSSSSRSSSSSSSSSESSSSSSRSSSSRSSSSSSRSSSSSSSSSADINYTYSTSFPLTEDPISESGNWLNGYTDGDDWSDVETFSGNAHGTQQKNANYNDSTAILVGNWAADQKVSGTVYKTGSPSSGLTPEVELRLRSSISASVNSGYEVLFSVTGSYDAEIVRWNGDVNDFTYLNQDGPNSALVDGDFIEAQIVGSEIAVWLNGRLVMAIADATYSSGAPGIGFYTTSATGAENDLYGWKDFEVSVPTVYTYSFTGSGDISANWTQLDWDYHEASGYGHKLVLSGSGTGKADTADDDCLAYYTGESFDPDQYSAATITGVSSNNYAIVGVRMNGSQATAGGYILYTNGVGTTKIAKIVNGSQTDLQTISSNGPVSGDRIKIEIIGTTLRAYKDSGSGWVQIGTDQAAGTDHSSGSPGCGVYYYSSDTTRIDNWEGGDVSGTVCWGHDTSVEETVARNFTANWTGTGTISGSGDSEQIRLMPGQYMESETWNMGSAMTVKLEIDKYGSGSGGATLKYKQGDSEANCEADDWHTYSTPFSSGGYIKLRLEA